MFKYPNRKNINDRYEKENIFIDNEFRSKLEKQKFEKLLTRSVQPRLGEISFQ